MSCKISVIIPTARRGDLLRECLDSLRGQTVSDFETVLVSDGAGVWVQALAKEYSCTLVSLPHARGFAAAINAGVAAGQSPYVALLNDDVRLSGDWLRLTSALLDERPDIAFCCGKIYCADGTRVDDAGDAVSLAGSAWRLGHGRKDSEEFASPRTVLAVPGMAALVRRKVFEEAGGFDEDFIAYLEDVDFSLRIARQGGQGFYLPQATSFHWGGATSGGPESPEVFRFLTQNQLAIRAKHFSWRMWLRLWPRIAVAQLLWLAMAIRKRRFGAYVAGVAHYIRLLPRMLRKRQPWQRGQMEAFLLRLRESEEEIYADTCAPDRPDKDTFWRVYFFLFAPVKGAPRAAKRAQGVGRAES